MLPTQVYMCSTYWWSNHANDVLVGQVWLKKLHVAYIPFMEQKSHKIPLREEIM